MSQELWDSTLNEMVYYESLREAHTEKVLNFWDNVNDEILDKLAKANPDDEAVMKNHLKLMELTQSKKVISEYTCDFELWEEVEEWSSDGDYAFVKTYWREKEIN